MNDFPYYTLLAITFYSLGLICAVAALWRSRTSQGATAWVVALISFPFVSVPLFVVFGRNKFFGYVRQRKELDQVAHTERNEIEGIFKEQSLPPKNLIPFSKVAPLSRQPDFFSGNQIQLLVNADEAYPSMLKKIDLAQKYILIQFYIFRTDSTGKRFMERLVKKASQGVRVYFLYDEIGCKIGKKHIEELRSAGVEVRPFHSTKSILSHFQLNFRNHRKVLVIDGHTAFIGGLNIGDDYLGLWPKIGPWRDTHVQICGPAALTAQLSFIKDWYWVTEKSPDLDWNTPPHENGSDVMVLHTGPADRGETSLLGHIALINSATQRIWIANPYFVPPSALISALELAVLRGVDVRIIVPSYSDNRWVMYASEVFQQKLLKMGVKFYKYMPGFLHQKVMLIDDSIGLVGSANLDPRSCFINFEIMAVSPDKKFVADLDDMLTMDFNQCEAITLEDFQRPLWRQFISRAVCLASPML